MSVVDEKVLYVRLPEVQHSEISDLARKEDRSITSMVRVLLSEAIEAREREHNQASKKVTR